MRRVVVLLRADGGQSSVELVAVLPLVVAVALAAGQVLAAGLADELVDHAAEAGAVALLQDADPRSAVRDSLPGWARRRADVSVGGSAVSVRLRPPTVLPGVAGLLEARARAHAGADAR